MDQVESPADLQPAPNAPLDDAPDAKWPKPIGIISLIYAIGGMLCASSLALLPVLSGFFQRMGGIEVKMPPMLLVVQVAFSILQFILGIMLITGAIGILRRRPSGVRWARRWAVLRLTLLAAGLAWTIFTGSAQIDFQRQMLDAQRAVIREQGGDPSRVPDLTDAQLWRRILYGSLGFGVVLTAYPVFLGLFLSRRAVNEEVARW